jgi:hypothetical protein
MRAFILGVVLWTGGAAGQTVINGGRTMTGPWDASGASSTKPARTGTALPGACSTGELFLNTSGAASGANLYVCTATNTWTQQGVAAGSITPAIRVIAAGVCSTCSTQGSLATVKTVTIPGGTLAAGDIVRIYGYYTRTGTTNIPRWAALFGGGTLTGTVAGSSSDGNAVLQAWVYVLSNNSQEGQGMLWRSGYVATTGSSSVHPFSLDVASPISVDFQAGFSSGTGETSTLRAYSVEVVKAQ